MAPAVCIVVALSGCAKDPLALSHKEITIPACADRSAVNLDTVGKRSKFNCDFSGIEFVFPDGERRKAPDIGTSTLWQGPSTGSKEGPSYELANLGIWGIVGGSQPHAGGKVTWWGTKTGLAKEWTDGRDHLH